MKLQRPIEFWKVDEKHSELTQTEQQACEVWKPED